MTNELYLKRDDVLNLFEEYQPRLATHVSEFGDALEDLKFRALESQPCEDAISREAVIDGLDKYIEKAQSTGTKDDFISFQELVVKQLPSVTPSYNSIKTELKPSGDCVSREDAVNALRKALYKYEDETEKQFKESKELNLEDWFQHRIFVQNMNDIDIQTILELPPVKPQPKIDEIISRIEEARDKDQIAEYPYNRCIKIIREVLGDEC